MCALAKKIVIYKYIEAVEAYEEYFEISFFLGWGSPYESNYEHSLQVQQNEGQTKIGWL